MANKVQRFFQRMIGINPSPQLKGGVVIKGWQNTENSHKLEEGDKVLIDTEKGTLLATYTGGDFNEPTNYKDLRIFSN